jgi:hypothetical protein
MEKIYFFDACAIVEYYQPQNQQSINIIQFINNNPQRCFISTWGAIETVSSLRNIFHGKVNSTRGNEEKELIKRQFLIISKRFLEDIKLGIFITKQLPRSYMKEATGLINPSSG